MNMISAIFNSALTISIPSKKALVLQHAKINGHCNGRTVRIPARCTPRVLFQPSALMVDGTSTDDRQIKTKYLPCPWGDTFSTFSFDKQAQQKCLEEIETLKKEAITMLMAATPRKVMIYIDKLERLGLAYHFEAEIEDKLKQVYHCREEKDYDMFTTALRFRLLRQHQYHISCKNTFEKFVDKDNKLKLESLSSDVEGLLSLYEAAHVRIHDENVLEEAVAFTTRHLTCMVPQLESPLKEKVEHALRFPFHKNPAIVTLHSYIDIYENDDSRNELLLRLAKLNFNFMQNVFRNELFQLSKWWNKLNVTSKVPNFRDRLAECYMWTMSFHFEPQYSHIRTLMTKLLMSITVMDDTYDDYATLDEITLFTQALGRWNIEEIDMLPDHLKCVYKLFMSTSEEFEREAEKQGNSYVIPYYIETVKQLARGYCEEQKWKMEKQLPSFQQYMINSRITSLMYVSLIACLTCIKSCTKETIDWIMISDCEILNVSSDILRLSDDLQDVNRCETEAGSILAYMKDTGASMQETKSEFKELIEDRWKHLTAKWVDCSMVPKEILVLFVDISRMCGIYYLDKEDNFTYPEKTLVPLITALLLDPTILV